MNNTTPTHTNIRSCGFIFTASAPDTSAPIGWLWACIQNEGLKWKVSEESDVACFVFLASGGRVCASCCASKNDIPLCESAQQSRTNQARHTVNLTVEYLSEWCKLPAAQMERFIIIIWHVVSIIDPFCGTAVWINDNKYVHCGIVCLKCWFSKPSLFSVEKPVIQG